MELRPPEAASFTAIDFETANRYRNSACAVGLVKVAGGVVVDRAYHLIRPPFAYFEFTHIHNIDWAMVRYEPTFAELWPRIAPFFEGVDFLAAHNAPFDKGVLSAVCAHYMLKAPELAYRCTVRMARTAWNVRPTTLRHVADHLGLVLDHHHAGSDAEACANIVIRALGGVADPAKISVRADFRTNSTDST